MGRATVARLSPAQRSGILRPALVAPHPNHAKVAASAPADRSYRLVGSGSKRLSSVVALRKFLRSVRHWEVAFSCGGDPALGRIAEEKRVSQEQIRRAMQITVHYATTRG